MSSFLRVHVSALKISKSPFFHLKISFFTSILPAHPALPKCKHGQPPCSYQCLTPKRRIVMIAQEKMAKTLIWSVTLYCAETKTKLNMNLLKVVDEYIIIHYE